MKKCFKCGECKPLSAFYKHKQMADGHLNKCKDCARVDVKKNRDSKSEYYRAYDRERGNRQKKCYVREWREKNPIKHLAQEMVASKIRSGEMRRSLACEECGSSERTTHGHHDDYAAPLVVRWLCPSCHRKWHIENGEGDNAR